MDVNFHPSWRSRFAGIMLVVAVVASSFARSSWAQEAYTPAIRITPIDVEQVSFPSPTSCCKQCSVCQSWACRRCRISCGCPDAYSDGGDALSTDPRQLDDPDADPEIGLFDGAQGATPALAAAQSSFGDFFSGGSKLTSSALLGGTLGVRSIVLPLSGGDRRYKLTEHNSPIPQDRVFFNYHHFENALSDAVGNPANLDRFTFGVEKTFRDGLWSIELRVPFASGLSSDQNGPTSFGQEFGNIALTFKRLLHTSECLTVSAGLGVIFPTADDAAVINGTSSLRMKNEAYHLLPFLGIQWMPNDCLWVQFFTLADFDLNGNTTTWVIAGGNPRVDNYRDQNLLFIDVSVGYWLFHCPDECRLLTGLAPIIELHYSTTLQDTDVFSASGQSANDNFVSNPFNRMDVVNLTAGLRAELFGRSYLTVAGVAPLRKGDEKLFDAEFGVQYSLHY
jgi:hypothetical protein